jgi:lauroyl-KDO2-lipid IV(A) myristoyltransferase
MSVKESNLHLYRFRAGLLHPRCWPTWLALGIYFLFTLLMPMSVIDYVGCRLGEYAAKKNRKRFNIARTNLSVCFPDKNEQAINTMVLDHFRAQLRSALHLFIVWWRPVFMVRKRLVREGFEQIDHYKQQGKQVIVLLCHSTGLDFAVASVSMDYNTNGPYKPMRNKVIDFMFTHGRTRFGAKFGGKLFTRDDGLRPLIRETRAGKVLVYLADEDLGLESSVFVPFFGVPKATIPVLGRMAKACNAVVLPCVSCYDPEIRKYRIKMLPALQDFPQGDDIIDSAAMNRAIEKAVLQCPSQYLWTFRYFQTRPEGEPPVYE